MRLVIMGFSIITSKLAKKLKKHIILYLWLRMKQLVNLHKQYTHFSAEPCKMLWREIGAKQYGTPSKGECEAVKKQHL